MICHLTYAQCMSMCGNICQLFNQEQRENNVSSPVFLSFDPCSFCIQILSLHSRVKRLRILLILLLHPSLSKMH